MPHGYIIETVLVDSALSEPDFICQQKSEYILCFTYSSFQPAGQMPVRIHGAD
jgi:hypothetical protein